MELDRERPFSDARPVTIERGVLDGLDAEIRRPPKLDAPPSRTWPRVNTRGLGFQSLTLHFRGSSARP
jgi:hypothetical protein